MTAGPGVAADALVVPPPERVAAAHRATDGGPAGRMLGPAELAVRARLRDVLPPIARRAPLLDRTHGFAGDSYRELAAAGLGGLVFPRELGGQGASTLAYAMAVEEIAAACPATSLVFMTQMHAAYPVLLAGTPAQQRRWIPPLCAGTAYGSLAITEPDAGSDVAALRTTAVRTGSGYRLSGSKTFITTGDRADVLVVFATVDRARGRDGITAFLVERTAAGVTTGQPLHKLGMHGSSTAEVFLDGVEVPGSARLGGEGQAWALSMRAVAKSRVSAAAQGVGIARAVLAHTTAFLEGVGSLREPWLTALATATRCTASARLLLYATAATSDGPGAGPSVADVAAMKATCTDAGVAAAETALELLGPYADLAACRVEQYLRDARVTQIYDGTNEVQHLLIGRDLRRSVEEDR